MDSETELLAHLKAALAIADRTDHLLAAQLCTSMQGLADRRGEPGPSEPPPAPRP